MAIRVAGWPREGRMRTIDAVETGVVSRRSGFRFALALLSVDGEQGLERGGLGDRVAPGGGRRESVLGGLSAASLLRTPPPGATRPPLVGVGAGLALGGVVLDGGTGIRPRRRPKGHGPRPPREDESSEIQVKLLGNRPETSGTHRPQVPAQDVLIWPTGALTIFAPVLGSIRSDFALAVAVAVAVVSAVLVQADRAFATLEAVL